MFKGSMVALVTPFKEDRSIDQEALENLINWHITSKTEALVLCGTTGEAPTLTEAEKIFIFKTAKELSQNKIKIIAGTGSYSTQKTVELTQKAKDLNLDAALIVVPYYNKPPIEGLIKHFEEVAKIDFPIILYHHPGRTGIRLSLEDFKKLEAIKNIVSIKEASSDLAFAKDLINNTRFDVLSGDDPLTIDMIKEGAKGVISVVANVIPKEFKEINDLCLKKDFEKARLIYDKHEELIKAMFLQTNPICVKYYLSLMQKCKSFLRLPLIEPQDKNLEILKACFENRTL